MTGKKAFTILLLCLAFPAFKAQAGSHERVFKFWVEFKDKLGTPYTILKPWDFLSDRALSRRKKAGFTATNDDLPVSTAYVEEVKKAGVLVQLKSRWMNAVLIETADSSVASKLLQETFIKKITLMGYWTRSRSAASVDPEAFGDFASLDYNAQDHIAVKNHADPNEYNDGYGMGWDQLNMLNLEALHKRGYKGKGVWIAVLDAGFYRANQLEAFDSLRANKRILGSYDFVSLDGNVYNDDDHGTQVLSCMAANVPGIMVGTAPEASYLLLRTEDARTEFPSEEAQWLAGAEYADSVGVDIINSSLGYTEFDREEFGHTYAELNGHTALITLAANMAYDRGIIIVNSAGNEGDGKWEKIGAPADAVGVLAIAAVDRDRNRASFSSMGPTADGRVKPDMAALGKRAIISGTSGYFYGSNGTSYSAPILAGALACLLQSQPEKDPAVLRSVLCMSAPNYLQPDTMLGFGIPDFGMAWRILHFDSSKTLAESPFFNWPSGDTLKADWEIKTTKIPASKYYYSVTDGSGNTSSGVLFKQEDILYSARIRFKTKGIYSITIKDGDRKWTKRIYFVPNS